MTDGLLDAVFALADEADRTSKPYFRGVPNAERRMPGPIDGNATIHGGDGVGTSGARHDDVRRTQKGADA